MKKKILDAALIVVMTSLFVLYGYLNISHAAKSKEAPVLIAQASPPQALPPLPTKIQEPQTPAEAIQGATDLVNAVAKKKWWFGVASLLFGLMFLLKKFNLLSKIDKRWSWWIYGGMTILAATFLAFDQNGFSWATFFEYFTAGTTAAWVRDWIKKGVLAIEPTRDLKTAKPTPSNPQL